MSDHPTPNSDYINAYLKESAAERDHSTHPAWLRDFFRKFHNQLVEKLDRASPGNRTVVTGAFAAALPHLLPEGVAFRKEVPLSEFFPSHGEHAALLDLVKTKRVDFLFEKDASRLFIEFKTNFNFNDLAAAMVEMAMVKKFITPTDGLKHVTASLHLFPYRANIAGLHALNTSMGSPLDHIWILCKGPVLTFDIPAIHEFRRSVGNALTLRRGG